MVHSERYAGKTVIINDVVVAFAANGECRGIVAYEGGLRPVSEPEPLRPQDLDVMRQFPDFYHIAGEVPLAEDSDVSAGDAGTETQNPGAAEDAGSVAEASGPEEADRSREGDAEELMALYTRDELAQMAEEEGLHVTSRTTKRQIAEMLVGGH